MKLFVTVNMDKIDVEGKPDLVKYPKEVTPDYEHTELHLEVIKDNVSYELGNILPKGTFYLDTSETAMGPEKLTEKWIK
jgi:hypothetical protein